MFSLSLKIRTTILIMFSFIIFMVISSNLILQYDSSTKLAIEATQEQFKQISSKIDDDMYTFNSKNDNFLNLLATIDGIDDIPMPNIRHKILPFIVQHIKVTDFIYSIYIGQKNGNYYKIINLGVSSKLKNKSSSNNIKWIIIKIINQNGKSIKYEEYLDENLNQLGRIKSFNKYGFLNKQWYKNAIDSSKIVKTKPYTFININKLGVTYSKKIKNDTVIGLDVTLNSLKLILNNQTLVEGSEIFLFDDIGKVILYNQIGRDVKKLRETMNDYYFKMFNTLRKKYSEIVEYEGKKYFKYSSLLNSKYGYGEYLGIMSPYDKVMKEYNSFIYKSIILSILLFLFVAIPLVLYSVRLIVLPMSKIEKENLKILKGKFSNVKKINSFIIEIDSLSDSLCVMSKSISKYIKSQTNLLDSFVHLIASTIDAKSKYTGEHCSRVPTLSLMIASAANKSNEGIFKNFSIDTEEEKRELSIASWLHDCGKVVTPEYVVDKATKLETIYNRIHEIRTRFEVIHRDLTIEALQKEINGESKEAINLWLINEHKKLIEEFEIIANANIGVESMSNEDKVKVKEIASRVWIRHFDDTIGLASEEKKRVLKENNSINQQENLISDKIRHIIPRVHFDYEEYKRMGFKTKVPEELYNLGELYNLCITAGTLTYEERFKIQEHVHMTLIMLEKLPFPDNLKNVSLFAGAHHETLVGTGYPRKLTIEDMPIASRIMAIADVFEALTASDRPYKEAKTLSESIALLDKMVKREHLDEDIFKLFLTTDIYLEYANKFLESEQIDFVDKSKYL